MVSASIQKLERDLRARLGRFVGTDSKRYYPHLHSVLEDLRNSNYRAFLCGGAVRNLLGRKIAVKVRVESTHHAARLLRELPGSKSICPNGEYVTVAGVSSQAVVAHLTSNGVIPSEVSSGPLDLESIFLEMTKQAIKEMG